MEVILTKKFEEFHPESIDDVFIDVVQRGEGTEASPYVWIYELKPVYEGMLNLRIRIKFYETDCPAEINEAIYRKYLEAAEIQEEVYQDWVKNCHDDLNDIF